MDEHESLDDIVERAVEDFREQIEAGGHPGSITKWAERYGISRFCLARRLRGIGAKRDQKPPNKKLSEAQEAALVRYIRDMDDIGISVRIDQVANAANHILAADWPEGAGEPPTVHKVWPKRFWERYPELHKMKQKPLALERKVAQEPEHIMNWFSRFQQLRDELGVQNEDIWNMDETGFRIGVGRSQWIITTIESRRAYLAADENRELVTSIEAISAGGHVLPPMFILQGKVHMEKWYEILKKMPKSAFLRVAITMMRTRWPIYIILMNIVRKRRKAHGEFSFRTTSRAILHGLFLNSVNARRSSSSCYLLILAISFSHLML